MEVGPRNGDESARSMAVDERRGHRGSGLFSFFLRFLDRAKTKPAVAEIPAKEKSYTEPKADSFRRRLQSDGALIEKQKTGGVDIDWDRLQDLTTQTAVSAKFGTSQNSLASNKNVSLLDTPNSFKRSASYPSIKYRSFLESTPVHPKHPKNVDFVLDESPIAREIHEYDLNFFPRTWGLILSPNNSESRFPPINEEDEGGQEKFFDCAGMDKSPVGQLSGVKPWSSFNVSAFNLRSTYPIAEE